MTTLPSIPPAAAPVVPATVGTSTIKGVRITWRVLERDTLGHGLRGGEVRGERIDATLSATRIEVRRTMASDEVTVMVLPAHLIRSETAAGLLLEWASAEASSADAGGPMARVLISPDSPPLVRSDLPARLGVHGGRHEVVDVTSIPDTTAD